MPRCWAVSAGSTALVGALLWVGPFLLRADLFDGDAAHHVFWLYRYADPGLFPGDLTVDYLRTSAPAGYRALYASVVPWADALQATKWVSFVLCLASVWLAYLVGSAVPGSETRRRGLLTALGLLVMLSVSTQTESLAPLGMQRAFGLPVTLLTLWGLVSRRYRVVGIAWVCGALFYPVVLPVLGLGAGLVFVGDVVRDRRLPDGWAFNGVAGVAALALALFAVPKAPELGPAATYAEAMAMPAFGPGGRLDLWGPGPDAVFWHGMTGLGWSPRVCVLLLVMGGAAVLLRRRAPVPLGAWALLGVGLLLWIALRSFPEQLMFGLYLPNRHPRWAIIAFGALAFSSCAQGLLLAATARRRQPGNRLRGAICLFTPVAAGLLLLPRALGQFERPVETDKQRTYAFLASLPTDTLVAAHPDAADYVPLFSRRRVLASTETSMPWIPGYFAQVKPRVEASLRAAYATSVAELDATLVPYGVDYFIVGPEADERDGYLQPYDAEVRKLQARAAAAGFPLRHPPEQRVVFTSGAYRVLRIGVDP